MIEQEWIECADPTPMLEFLKEKARERKLRLFACACCRSVWKWLTDERSRNGVAAVEFYAEASEAIEELNKATEESHRAMEDASGDSESAALGHTKWHAATAVVYCAIVPMRWDYARDVSLAARQAESCYVFESDSINDGIEVPFPEPEPIEGSAHAAILRDIFGNPFLPVTLDPRWLSSTVLDLARTIYDERAFERMPILADALMDAGCDSEEVINHCRSDGPHVRGCWVVDLLLGNE